MNFVLTEKELLGLGVKEEDIIKLSFDDDKICCGSVSKGDIILEAADLYFRYDIKGEEVMDFNLAKEMIERLHKREPLLLWGDSFCDIIRIELEYRTQDNGPEDKEIADHIFKLRDSLERMGER